MTMPFAMRHAVTASLLFAAAAAQAAPVLVIDELAFGSHVLVQVGLDGKPVYMPSLRYAQGGDVISLQYEYLRDTTQAARGDFGSMPVIDMGELPPGTYTLDVRGQNVDPAIASDVTYSHQFTVDAPTQPGLYTVPQQPDASGQSKLVIVAGTGLDPRSVKVSVGTGTVRVDYLLDAFSLSQSVATVSLPPLAAGVWHVEAWAASPYGGDPTRSATRDIVVQPVVPVIEYFAEDTDQYFLTAAGTDVAALDRGDYGPWKRTGQRFKAWGLASNAPGSKPVCRFYSAGSNSHLFTMDGTECDRLKALQVQGEAQANANKASFLGWRFEGVAFYAMPPVNGDCLSSYRPVYRFSKADGSGNTMYRFTDSGAQLAPMQATWKPEGVAFCSPA